MMTAHVAQRLAKEINKHRGKSLAQSEKSIQSAQEKYSLDQILRKGLAGVAQVTVATHIAKGVHPDLKVKEVTNLNLGPGELTPLPELGSHIASNKSPADTTGNGAHASAAYELYLLLDLEFEGKTLYQWLDEHDPDIVFALTQGIAEDSDRLALASQFTKLLKTKVSRPASHTYAKQLYWLVDEDPVDDGAYHLLAPLYPTSLVHEVYNRIQEDRFGEESKAARGARREEKFHEAVVHDYPDLAVQKLGGTKPQNISQLNSERRGVNYLLSCTPPTWKPVKQRGLFKTASIFDRIYGRIPTVNKTVHSLRNFLEDNPRRVMETRDRRDGYIATLIDELVQLASGYQQGFPPGWSLNSETELNEDERLWLDPYRAAFEEEYDFREKWLWMDWPGRIGDRFAVWLKGQLEGKLLMGDVEFRHWKKELLLDESESGWARELHKQCHEIHQRCKRFPSSKREDKEKTAKEVEAEV